jgi:putative DNA primase/helicase
MIRNSAGKLGPGLDVRGDGGYVVVPPSVHPQTKGLYRWAIKVKPARVPAWLLETLSAYLPAIELGSDASIPAGQRNDTLARIAGTMRRRGCTQSAIQAALLAENAQRCNPPLSENEVRAIAHSVSRYTPERPRAAEAHKPETEAVLRCFRDIAPEQVCWLWPKRIPLGKLTLLVGDPGLGKSLVTIDLASRVTRAAEFPDGSSCDVGDVIFLSAEDDPADTIRPRLDAAGADVSRVHILEAVRVTLGDGTQTEKAFNLETDLAALEAALRQHPGVRLIVIDPISAYLGGVDSHSNSEVRGILARLASLAARYGLAIGAVTHLRKSAGAAIHRAIASIAFAAAARAVWAVAADPNDLTRRLMLAVKQNLAPDRGGLAFRVEAPESTARVAWEPEAVLVDANEVLGAFENGEERSALLRAKTWLSELLQDGPLLVEKLKAEARGADIAWATVRRAKESLSVVAKKGDYQGAWYWRLNGPQGEDAQSHTSRMSTFEQLADSEEHSDCVAHKHAQSTHKSTFNACEDDSEVRL